MKNAPPAANRLRLPAFAKINWTLRVLGKRADGYHEICTVFQTVSLADNLSFELSDELTLSCDQPHVPVDERNLILQAANVLRERFSIQTGAKIHLEKRIPSPGGLGGGSSDAAVALLALSLLWRTNSTRRELARIGADLGADVPFFLTGGTALGTGLGTEIELLADAPKKLLLIVTPNETVVTAEAYKLLAAPLLTTGGAESKLAICRLEAESQGFFQTELHNDFENTIFRLRPEIARTKTKLLAAGARTALLSGSGASVFGVFDNETARQAAHLNLRESETNWRIFSCETVSRPAYRRSLQPCLDLFGGSA